MASNFPSSLDSFTNPSSSDAMDSVSVPHATQHSDLNDAVEALQAKVGADSSAVTSSLDYKVAQLESGATGGKILQVVSTTKTDVFSSTSSSFTAITGLSASITPSSATSKVLVMLNIKGCSTQATSSSNFNYRLMRGATAIGVGDAAGSRNQVTGSIGTRSTGSETILMADTAVILDSPATTSATTYSVQGRSNTTVAWYVNRTQEDTDSAFYPRSVSSITLIEVSA